MCKLPVIFDFIDTLSRPQTGAGFLPGKRRERLLCLLTYSTAFIDSTMLIFFRLKCTTVFTSQVNSSVRAAE